MGAVSGRSSSEQLQVLATMHAMATVAWAHEHADLHFQALGEHGLRRVLG
jgi:hypothetical protein